MHKANYIHMRPSISLGSAQFGLDYGITNSGGKVSHVTVSEVLEAAHKYGIKYIDTAQVYGDAQKVIGNSHGQADNFKITSKLSPQKFNTFSSKHYHIWDNEFHETLSQLRVASLDAYLVHDVRDLSKNGSTHLIDWLLSLKCQGLVNRLGVSIYDIHDLVGVPNGLLDVIQVPFSLYDQRFFEESAKAKIAINDSHIQARSIYLQGILLASSAEWPSWVSNDAITTHRRLENFAQEMHLTLLQLTVDFIKSRDDLDSFVVGICSIEQLDELMLAYSKPQILTSSEWKQWHLNFDPIIDPRYWPSS